MTLQVHKACLGGLFDKFGVQILVTGYKRYIHNRTVFFADRALEQLTGIQEVIENLCLFFISRLHHFQTALLLQPFENLAAHVDAVAVRSVVKRIGIRMDLVLHISRRVRKHILGNQILPDDDDGHACGTHIFLYAAVDQTIFAYVYRLG